MGFPASGIQNAVSSRFLPMKNYNDLSEGLTEGA
jgi:hypothetical protein